MSTEGQRLQRITRVLEGRGAPLERVLGAVTVSGTSTLFLGIAALSSRLELRVPVRPDALAAVAPDLAPPPQPPKGMLRLFVDGAQVDPAVLTVGATPARAAVDELIAPGAAHDAWYAIVDTMPVLAAGGAIMNRTKYLAHDRAAIAVAFPARAADAEPGFVQRISGLAGVVGLSLDHQAAWKRVAATAGAGPISVSTECSTQGPAPYLSCVYGHSPWDQAIDLVQVLVDEARARQVAATLGALAAALEVDQPRGLEIVFKANRADVIVWLGPQAGG